MLMNPKEQHFTALINLMHSFNQSKAGNVYSDAWSALAHTQRSSVDHMV